MRKADSYGIMWHNDFRDFDNAVDVILYDENGNYGNSEYVACYVRSESYLDESTYDITVRDDVEDIEEDISEEERFKVRKIVKDYIIKNNIFNS